MKCSKVLKAVVVILATLGMTVACNNKKSQKSSSQISVNGQEILNEKGSTPEEKAEKLALGGEQLFMPDTFFLADPIFKEALKLDPKNKRALLYSNLLAPLMQYKGIHARIDPLIKKDPENYIKHQKEDYAGYQLFEEFLKDGVGDIDTELKVQQFLDKQVVVLNKSREFFKNNKDLTLELNISQRWHEARLRDRFYKCRYSKIMDLSYDVKCETDLKVMRVKVDRGEIEAFQSYTAGMQIYNILSSAYDMTGVQQVKVEKQADKLMTQKNMAESLFSNSSFGTLRTKGLKSIIALGSDAMMGVRWAQSMQETLCPTSKAEKTFVYQGSKKIDLRRKGYLIDEGICINKYDSKGNLVEKLLTTIEGALKGVAYVTRTDKVVNNQTVGSVEANVNPAVILNNPIQDLRAVAPSKFNDCEEVHSFTDNTLGGLFPDGDADTFLRESKQISKKQGECVVP